MALHLRNLNKVKMENENVVGKKVVAKRGVLGEIGNRQVLKPVGPGVPIKKDYKNVQAKVVTHHSVALKGEKTRPLLLRRGTSTSTVATKANASKISVDKQQSNSAANAVEVQVQPPAVESYSAGLLNVEDIDKDDEPIHTSEYSVDIYKYLFQLENKFKIREDFLQDQVISKKMRTILVQWLVEVHMQFHLLQETLHLTVAIIDRFLQDYPKVDRKHLQLVGVAAMSVACKYEEMFAPEIGDFVYITDNTYTKLQIQRMEIKILQVLDYNLGRPISLHFLRRFSKASGADAQMHTFGKYFLELCLCEYQMSHLPPSIIAAASTFLYLYIQPGDESVWSDTLIYYTTYRLQDIKPVVKLLASLVLKASESSSVVFSKYQSSKLLKISARPELSSQKLKDYAADPQL